MRSLRLSVLAFTLAVAACGSEDPTEPDYNAALPERLGSVDFCFAAASDADREPFVLGTRDEVRTGVNVVDVADRTSPPETFDSCAAGKLVQGELVDDAGDRIWLALDAVYGGQDLLPPDLLSLVSDADIQVVTSPFDSRRWISISVGGSPIVILQKGGPLPSNLFGQLRVTTADTQRSFLPSLCGPVMPTVLSFGDDQGQQQADVGESAQLVLGGRESIATNIYTMTWDENVTCDDGPLPGVEAVWVFADASL